jgi:hypothetical protein
MVDKYWPKDTPFSEEGKWNVEAPPSHLTTPEAKKRYVLPQDRLSFPAYNPQHSVNIIKAEMMKTRRGRNILREGRQMVHPAGNTDYVPSRRDLERGENMAAWAAGYLNDSLLDIEWKGGFDSLFYVEGSFDARKQKKLKTYQHSLPEEQWGGVHDVLTTSERELYERNKTKKRRLYPSRVTGEMGPPDLFSRPGNRITETIQRMIKERDAKGPPWEGKARGFVPNFNAAMELNNSYSRAGTRVVSLKGIGLANTEETLGYHPSFTQPFVNPPEGSREGMLHKMRAVSQTGINPYSIPNTPLASQGSIPEIDTSGAQSSLGALTQEFDNLKTALAQGGFIPDASGSGTSTVTNNMSIYSNGGIPAGGPVNGPDIAGKVDALIAAVKTNPDLNKQLQNKLLPSITRR